MLTIPAPAKLNLTLEVLSRRPDGFHEISSVLQAIDLCDTLRFRSSDGVEFLSGSAGWSAGQSLVSRAVRLVQEQTGRRGVAVEVIKKIPLVSGLGGDSSDAAAVLLGLNQIWGLGLSLNDLLGLATELGS
ncbi:MAG: 4-diphosphocytidyl-2C-methyl-D-erythritol kinase, partial [Chloroflexota bacterium]